MNGAELIAAERQRQIEAEGWTPEHDAEHTDSALVAAAVAYARLHNFGPATARSFVVNGDVHWPWDEVWFKPTADPIRNLVKAGALIAAEIDRRAAALPEDGKQA